MARSASVDMEDDCTGGLECQLEDLRKPPLGRRPIVHLFRAAPVVGDLPSGVRMGAQAGADGPIASSDIGVS